MEGFAVFIFLFFSSASCRNTQMPSFIPTSCTGTIYQPNMTLQAGSDLSLSCPVQHCPITRITWFRSHTKEGLRFPLVSEHPLQFGIQTIMPVDSGWYWCVADSYESGRQVQVMDTPATPITITPATPITITPVAAPATTITPVMEAPVFVPLTVKAGTADQLNIYQTYDRRWSDHQEKKAKLMAELEAMIARYLGPVHRQLDDIYIRVAKMERTINEA